MTWDPYPYPDTDTERGIAFSLRHGRGGASTGGVEALLSNGLAPGGSSTDSGGGSTEVLLGYGIRVMSGRYTEVPEVGVGRDGSGSDYRLSVRLLRGGMSPGDFEMRLDADPGSSVGLRLHMRW